MENYITIIMENWDTIAVFIGSVIAIIRLTAWGKANKEALDTVTAAIEKVNAKEVKEQVKMAHAKLDSRSSNALQDSVRMVDKKT